MRVFADLIYRRGAEGTRSLRRGRKRSLRSLCGVLRLGSKDTSRT